MASIRKNTVWNFLGSATPMLVGILVIPYLISNIGVERFGVLTLIWSLIGYFSIFDFGIGRALTYQVSNSIAKKESLAFLVKSGLKLMFITGIIGGGILLCISKQLGYKWLNTSLNLREEAFQSIVIASLAIPFTTYTSGLKGILEGFEEFKVVNILKFLLGLLNFILPIFSILIFGQSLVYIVISLALSRFIIFLAHLLYVNNKISLFKILKNKESEKKSSLSILNFGAWMTLSNIVSPLMVQADRFLISYMLGASLVAYYTIPFDLVIRLLIIPASLTSVLFPRFSTLFATDINASKVLFDKSLKVIFITMSVVTFLIIICSHLGLSLWISKEVANKSWIILCVLSVGLLFNSIAQVPYALIQATGKVKLTSIIHLCEFVFYIILLLSLLHFFGILGAAIAFSIRTCVDFLALNHFSKKLLNV